MEVFLVNALQDEIVYLVAFKHVHTGFAQKEWKEGGF
jgi:hypothetical protein